jgi:hypothetical protein
MQLTLVNGFYIATNARAGGYSGAPTTEQINNANIIRSFFINAGWTINAICGMLGCMQGESTVNPAFIQATNRYRLPNAGDDLTDVPNSVMRNFFMEYFQDTRKAYAIGLVQWDGYTVYNQIDTQKMVAFAIANNIIWYDGWTQLYRIDSEQFSDESQQRTDFFYTVRVSGVEYNFSNYPYSLASPEDLAKAFTWGYERNAGGEGFRPENARRWYDLFTGPDAPDIIDPVDFLTPLEADPLEPPFNPDNPVMPTPYGTDFLPAWLTKPVILKGGLNKIWRKA